ncbi:hypothetical protein LEL_10570 [Akanthomyces lecanii RCEF 1005]|uniref:Uncharacterized protein n=1 Tax=Akanthomyces lecanii RCEF 1005 TaxID=1081108 RepID=A0A167XLI0_CORDF|nr:hypothetical protein LEL_10570 [Akanthomyces lecanii RCEF 1005]
MSQTSDYGLSLDKAQRRARSNPFGVLSQVASSVSAVATEGVQNLQNYGQQLLQTGINVTASMGLEEQCFGITFAGLDDAKIDKCTPFTRLARLPAWCAGFLAASFLFLASAYWGGTFWGRKDGWRRNLVRGSSIFSCLGSLGAWLTAMVLLLCVWSLYNFVDNAAAVTRGPAVAMCWVILAAASFHVLETPYLVWHTWL